MIRVYRLVQNIENRKNRSTSTKNETKECKLCKAVITKIATNAHIGLKKEHFFQWKMHITE